MNTLSLLAVRADKKNRSFCSLFPAPETCNPPISLSRCRPVLAPSRCNDVVAARSSGETGWSYSGSPTIDRHPTRSLPLRSSCGDAIDCRTYFGHYTHPGCCANLGRRANLNRRAQLRCRRVGRAVHAAARRAARHLQRCGDRGCSGGGSGHGPVPVLATSLPATGGRAVAAAHLRSYPREPAKASLQEPMAAYARARSVLSSWPNGAPRVGIGSPTRPEGWRAAIPRACSHDDRHGCGRDPAQRLRSADATEGLTKAAEDS